MGSGVHPQVEETRQQYAYLMPPGLRESSATHGAQKPLLGTTEHAHLGKPKDSRRGMAIWRSVSGAQVLFMQVCALRGTAH